MKDNDIETKGTPVTSIKQTKQRKAHKRGDGEGSIYRRDDGMWRGRIMVGYNVDGKPDSRTVYGKTRAEVQRKLQDLRQRHQSGTLGNAVTERDTVGGFLTRWLETTKPNLRPTTWQRYADLVRLHVAPLLGGTKLAVLRPDDLQNLYATKREQGLSPRTVRQLHAVLHRAFSQAVRWGYASRNVADAVDTPRFPRFELVPPTALNLGRLLDTIGDDPLSALWTLAIYSGCREGELLGLRWQDVDMDARTLSVRQTLLSLRSGVPEFGEPKTASSRRTISLPDDAVVALRRHRQMQEQERAILGPDYAPYNLVFTRPGGQPIHARSLIRFFKKALKRADLPSTVRFHDLRHAAATLMLAAGVHPKVASQRLGHSTISITMDLYTHAVEGLDADAAERMVQTIRLNRTER